MLKKTPLAVALALLAALLLAGSASAHTGEFAKFNYCPSTNPEAFKCLYSVTYGGKIVLGSKTTPITNPTILQGAYTETNREKKHISKFLGAVNGGETLTKVPQPVPGGLAGLINCKEIENFLARIACELVFENELTGVNATLELAKPASEIQISEFNLLGGEGVALKLPVKVHLENPFLGSSCYVGSSTTPLTWNLTTGETEATPPITGKPGFPEVYERGEITKVTENELVDNNWKAPGATGCAEPFSIIIDPILNLALGLPANPPTNSAKLENTIYIARPASVNSH